MAPMAPAVRALLRRPTPGISPAVSAAGSRRHVSSSTAAAGSRDWPPEDKTETTTFPNIYTRKGTFAPFDIWVPGPGRVRARVDMPGADPGGLGICFMSNHLCFTGREDPKRTRGLNLDTGGKASRTYGSGSIQFHPSDFPLQRCFSQLLNGVLWLEIQSSNPSHDSEPAILEIDPRLANRDGVFNPFVSEGFDCFFCYGFKADAFLLSVDVPGLADGNQVLNVDGEKIWFRGEESKQHPFAAERNEPSRLYEVGFEVDLRAYNAKGAKAEVNHGVLYVEVPRHVLLPPGTKDPAKHGWVRLDMIKFMYQIDGRMPLMEDV